MESTNLSLSLKPPLFSSSNSFLLPKPNPPCYLQNQPKPSIPICRFGHATDLTFLSSPHSYPLRFQNKRFNTTHLRATRRESPYQVLGVSPSASPQEIKRAYRKLALKFHPDVNKEANVQEKFMRIKHAYNMLMNSEARQNYDSGSRSSSYTNRRSQSRSVEEEFYGFGNVLKDVQITLEDLLRDLQAEWKNWEESADSQGKPKSLWEELADIGEEFVEFLEKELNITDEENNSEQSDRYSYDKSRSEGSGADGKTESPKEESSIEDSIDDIEETLAQLKKELGL